MPKFNNQGGEDLAKLQLEAARRVREMQSKIKKTVQNEQFSSQTQPPNRSAPEQKAESTEKKELSCEHQKNAKTSLPNLLDAILKDDDRLLVLALIVMLLGEEENTWVLLVLLYLVI